MAGQARRHIEGGDQDTRIGFRRAVDLALAAEEQLDGLDDLAAVVQIRQPGDLARQSIRSGTVPAAIGFDALVRFEDARFLTGSGRSSGAGRAGSAWPPRDPCP